MTSLQPSTPKLTGGFCLRVVSELPLIVSSLAGGSSTNGLGVSTASATGLNHSFSQSMQDLPWLALDFFIVCLHVMRAPLIIFDWLLRATILARVDWERIFE